MATTEENMVTFLKASASIKEAVKIISYNHVPQDKQTPYIFFQQSGADDDIALGDAAGEPNRPAYDIEVWSDKPDEAVAVKKLVHARLHKHRGTFGGSTVQAIFAKDVDDNYVPNGAGDDDGLHGSFFRAEVVL